MDIAFAQVGPATSVLESVATSIGAGILIGSFVMGGVGVFLGWSRQDLEARALKDGYVGGIVAVFLLVFDVVMRYFV